MVDAGSELVKGLACSQGRHGTMVCPSSVRCADDGNRSIQEVVQPRAIFEPRVAHHELKAPVPKAQYATPRRYTISAQENNVSRRRRWSHVEVLTGEISRHRVLRSRDPPLLGNCQSRKTHYWIFWSVPSKIPNPKKMGSVAASCLSDSFTKLEIGKLAAG